MADAALILYLAWFALAFVWRSAAQRRRTGDSGFRGISGSPWSTEWIAGALLVAALGCGLLAPVADLVGLVRLPGAGSATAVVGTGLAVVGIASTMAAQAALGSSWRVGVDATEHTDLVTGGLFGVVRNPIFTTMLITATGLTLMVPNLLSLAALLGATVAIELQVRVVEEPVLAAAHGDDYRRYAEAVGRFLPGLGRATKSDPEARRAGSDR
ncbi:isoprenylcysteine carboxylmethyltransferase family protein [Iamia majanohamensis]|uniref:Isoprenylcysteine carboxylmethyltransferase family protein n=1 Tax=Iamia majanohamensis TaxID=467976 RepID=A0AAE9Y7H6_9ACTN|nr:isoprenylcysteine carboxylmethyltransferase family protein [Iamia majanohamensis]WCO67977.1 isoprenylcysteine carboxylmethyltransferase family protein [Iamia majanohamensis]